MFERPVRDARLKGTGSARASSTYWQAQTTELEAPAMIPEQRPDVEILAAVIARSEIVVGRVAAQPAARQRLPSGFEEVDLAILDWIAREGRRLGRGLARM
jgi:hypothetical protein